MLLILGPLAYFTFRREARRSPRPINPKAARAIAYLLEQAGEASTWQGIGAVVSLIGGRAAGMDWGAVAALAAAVSGLIKILLPDRLRIHDSTKDGAKSV